MRKFICLILVMISLLSLDSCVKQRENHKKNEPTRSEILNAVYDDGELFEEIGKEYLDALYWSGDIYLPSDYEHHVAAFGGGYVVVLSEDEYLKLLGGAEAFKYDNGDYMYDYEFSSIDEEFEVVRDYFDGYPVSTEEAADAWGEIEKYHNCVIDFARNLQVILEDEPR